MTPAELLDEMRAGIRGRSLNPEEIVALREHTAADRERFLNLLPHVDPAKLDGLRVLVGEHWRTEARPHLRAKPKRKYTLEPLRGREGAFRKAQDERGYMDDLTRELGFLQRDLDHYRRDPWSHIRPSEVERSRTLPRLSAVLHGARNKAFGGAYAPSPSAYAVWDYVAQWADEVASREALGTPENYRSPAAPVDV